MNEMNEKMTKGFILRQDRGQAVYNKTKETKAILTKRERGRGIKEDPCQTKWKQWKEFL